MLPKINNIFRLTRLPELRYGNDSKEICKINVACSEKYGQRETNLFIDAVAFGKGATFLNNVRKGDRIFISGKLSPNNYEKQDGTKVYGFQILIDSFEYIEKKEESSQYTQDQNYTPPKEDNPGSQNNNPSTASIEIDDEDCPF